MVQLMTHTEIWKYYQSISTARPHVSQNLTVQLCSSFMLKLSLDKSTAFLHVMTESVLCHEDSVVAGATIVMMNGLLLDLDDFVMSAIHQQIRQEVRIFFKFFDNVMLIINH